VDAVGQLHHRLERIAVHADPAVGPLLPRDPVEDLVGLSRPRLMRQVGDAERSAGARALHDDDRVPVLDHAIEPPGAEQRIHVAALVRGPVAQLQQRSFPPLHLEQVADLVLALFVEDGEPAQIRRVLEQHRQRLAGGNAFAGGQDQVVRQPGAARQRQVVGRALRTVPRGLGIALVLSEFRDPRRACGRRARHREDEPAATNARRPLLTTSLKRVVCFDASQDMTWVGSGWLKNRRNRAITLMCRKFFAGARHR
jgi:hypothetical protein